MAYIYNMTDLWDDIEKPYDAIKMDVDDQNSSIDSNLIDLKINSSTKFSIDKTGALLVGNVEKTLENLNISTYVFLEDLKTEDYVYYGGETSSGKWKVNRFDASVNKTVANKDNNPTYETLTLAWIDLETLVYS